MYFDEQTFFGQPDNFVTVRHLTMRGTNFEIGRKLGEMAIERYGASLARHTAKPVIARARRLYFQRNYPIHWERVRGVAAAFGLDLNDERYDVTNLTYNLDLPPQAPGCSVVYYPPSMTASGSGYLSRNYDFSVGAVADIKEIPLPPAPKGIPKVKDQMPAVMSEPYIMEWHPSDGGYASFAIHAFDTLSGTLDGMNSAGLAVSILADEEASEGLGPNLELHLGTPQVIGLHELQVMRLLLDTCATVEEAKEALLTVKQYYLFIPCHYIIADKSGHSFIYENSTGRNVQHIIDGTGQPQVITNFQVHKYPTRDQMPSGELTLETNAFWRYQRLEDLIVNHDGPFTPDEIKYNNACVSVLKLFEALHGDPAYRSIAASDLSRTLWHSLYDQAAGRVEFSFYLGEKVNSDGTRTEQHSDYLEFVLDA